MKIKKTTTILFIFAFFAIGCGISRNVYSQNYIVNKYDVVLTDTLDFDKPFVLRTGERAVFGNLNLYLASTHGESIVVPVFSDDTDEVSFEFRPIVCWNFVLSDDKEKIATYRELNAAIEKMRDARDFDKISQLHEEIAKLSNNNTFKTLEFCSPHHLRRVVEWKEYRIYIEERELSIRLKVTKKSVK